VIRMNGNTGITLSDATEANRNPGYTEDEGCEVTLPFTTGLTRILLPAGSPIVKPSPMSPRLGCPGQRDIMIFEAELAYKPTTPKGDLVMLEWRGTTVERMSDGLHQVPAREVFDAVYLLSEGQIVAMDTLLAGDEIVLEPVGEFVLARGSSRVFEIACDIASDANLGNFVIEFADSAFLDLRDRELLTGIHPVLTGQDYPVQTAEIAIEAGGLSNSFVNWPNPFNPAGETTTIGFVLGEDAHVDIEIFTITGELVKKVCTNSFRSAGPHDQQDTWDGSDNSGHSVQPGTYFCRITARYGSGRTEDARRKVAVTR
jgi:hypothetical protein